MSDSGVLERVPLPEGRRWHSVIFCLSDTRRTVPCAFVCRRVALNRTASRVGWSRNKRLKLSRCERDAHARGCHVSHPVPSRPLSQLASREPGVAPEYGDRSSEAFWRRLSPRSRFGSQQCSLACLNPALSHGRLVAFKSSQDYASTTGCVRLGSCPRVERRPERRGQEQRQLEGTDSIVFEANGNAAARIVEDSRRTWSAQCRLSESRAVVLEAHMQREQEEEARGSCNLSEAWTRLPCATG